MCFNNHHVEEITFFEYCSPSQPVIMEYPWLRQHNPQVDWATGEITFDPEICHSCISQTSVTSTVMRPVQRGPDIPNLFSAPTCYHDLKEVFSKSKATSLSLHRPYDCDIDFIPGSSPPKGWLYSLSSPETQAMREYIQPSLKAGIIHPSSSPAGAGFFFVSKKNKSLHAYISYGAWITLQSRITYRSHSSAPHLRRGQLQLGAFLYWYKNAHWTGTPRIGHVQTWSCFIDQSQRVSQGALNMMSFPFPNDIRRVENS